MQGKMLEKIHTKKRKPKKKFHEKGKAIANVTL